MDKLVMYSNHCPKCNVLEKKLQAKNIKFELNENISELEAYNFDGFLPVLKVDDKIMAFAEAVAYINAMEISDAN